MKRYVCIHGHFYQPPRENPWLEDIELQDSAYPYHDWNDRISYECYAPNAASRILEADGKIRKIINNYSWISFNFGPTLLSWLEKKRPDVYQAILRADQESQERFSGHGSALAQVYNHLIMPLADPRDQETQVIWGIRDFESRFKRQPEGMWLPETAVNLETLESLARHGILFTILAPHQASRIRRIGEPGWTDVQGGQIDPKRPYLCRLPSGNSIVLFFYDGPIAHEVGFGNLLDNGGRFADRLTGVFASGEDESQLVHIATDGESYGHHHRFGDMALSYCLDRIKSKKMAKLTVYGEYLAIAPPAYEVEIFEHSSWSCAHGVERWRDNCGCHSGMHPRWKQLWRKPLRTALDTLRKNLASFFEVKLGQLVSDPWLMRNQYIEVIMNRDRPVVDAFLKKHLDGTMHEKQAVLALKLLEMERHALLMFTSCGWFFDDIAGIESTQILLFAARAVQLARECGGKDLEGELQEELSKAPGNQPEFPSGKAVWDVVVQPQTSDLFRVGAHYAVSSMFRPANHQEDEGALYSYRYHNADLQRCESGKERLLLGKVHITSEITREELAACFAMVYFGGYNLLGGVIECNHDGCLGDFSEQLITAFNRVDVADMVRLMDHHFGTRNYTLRHLFRDEQRHVLETIMQETLVSVEISYRQIYQQNYPIMQVMREFHFPVPRTLRTAGEHVVNIDLTEALAASPLNFDRLGHLITEVHRWGIEIDRVTVGYVAENTINRLIECWIETPDDSSLLETIVRVFNVLESLSVSPDLGYAQNLLFRHGKIWYDSLVQSTSTPDKAVTAVLCLLDQVAEHLRVNVR